MDHFSISSNHRLCSRRQFVEQMTYLGIGGLSVSGLSAAVSSEKQRKHVPEKKASQRHQGKLGIALVGLGQYSEGQLAPALQETQHCYLAGIVTGTPEKVDKWRKKYGIPEANVYNYENFDNIKDNPDIDIIYVVLPNSMHAEYTIRAAEAGKHVICEKPMAITVEDCDSMIAACEKAGKKLSIGYRLHFEPHHKEAMRLGREKTLGNIQTIRADNGMSDVSGWRLDKALAGGGPLMDLGIYCVQAARYSTGMEPVAVNATEGVKTNPKKFRGIEESLTWRMEFPSNIIADCKSSYSEDADLLRIEAEEGWYELSPAYPYSGIKGESSNGKLRFNEVNQQALQMDDFSLAIKENRPTIVPGEMGRQDVKILQAIYKAIETGERVEIT